MVIGLNPRAVDRLFIIVILLTAAVITCAILPA